jgi:predicted NBD/HSP70 family sugar kinase
VRDDSSRRTLIRECPNLPAWALMKRRTTTSRLLRHLNRAAVINLIRQQEVISPTRIASELNISIATVMRVVESLIEEDLVEYGGFGESTGGRPPANLKFKGSSYGVVGVDLGAPRMFGAVSDLNGHIQTERYADCDPESGELNLKRLIHLIGELLEESRALGLKIRGIGVGVPSIVRAREGHVERSQKLHWRDLPLKKILTEHFSEQVFVDNMVNLTAVAEWGFGAGRGGGSLVCLVVGTGTGAGIILNGTLFRGHSHAAGEIGWLLHNELLSGRRFPRLGRSKDLNYGPGMPQKVFDTLEALDLEFLAGNFDVKTLSNPKMLKANPSLLLAHDMIDYLTFSIAILSTVLNPPAVILAGDISRCAQLVADRVRDRLEGQLPSVPQIVVSELGYRAVALGAIMTVLDATALNKTIAS